MKYQRGMIDSLCLLWLECWQLQLDFVVFCQFLDLWHLMGEPVFQFVQSVVELRASFPMNLDVHCKYGDQDIQWYRENQM